MHVMLRALQAKDIPAVGRLRVVREWDLTSFDIERAGGGGFYVFNDTHFGRAPIHASTIVEVRTLITKTS